MRLVFGQALRRKTDKIRKVSSRSGAVSRINFFIKIIRGTDAMSTMGLANRNVSKITCIEVTINYTSVHAARLEKQKTAILDSNVVFISWIRGNARH